MRSTPTIPSTGAQHWTAAAALPGWVERITGLVLPTLPEPSDKPTARRSDDGAWALVRAVVPDLEGQGHDAVRRRVAEAYAEALAAFDALAPITPVRAWNVIPDIHRSEPAGGDRYMAFNAGRNDAYTRWFGDAVSMTDRIPTASAVGDDGRDLVINLLGHFADSQNIENPRQVPAFSYSQKYGPVPPSFVRATLVRACPGRLSLLVAGTASVVGEDSLHADDLAEQLNETFRNLAAVVREALAGRGEMQTLTDQCCLSRYRAARVYLRHAPDRDVVTAATRASLPCLTEIEVVRADICRPELLVEIEGLATLDIDGA